MSWQRLNPYYSDNVALYGSDGRADGDDSDDCGCGAPSIVEHCGFGKAFIGRSSATDSISGVGVIALGLLAVGIGVFLGKGGKS